MSYVVVVPYTYKPYFDEFMATCKIPSHLMLTIDNTTAEKNIGVMASHNRGIDFMREWRADWLIVISPAIRFGKPGGLDFLEILEERPDYHVIHGASLNVAGGKQAGPEGGGHNKVFGWHLMAINKTVFDAIGRWDENFTPYGFDDIDLSLRIRKHFKNTTKWDTYPCDVTDTVMGHSLQFVPDVVGEADSGPRIAYFTEKWGRHPGAWQWDGWEHPFNNPENSLKFWPPAPNGGKWDDNAR
jgi:hypothetical protein